MILSLMLFTFSQYIIAENDITYCIYLKKASKEEPDQGEIGNKGHRAPARPINCVINRNGVYIHASIDKANIISYELWTLSDVCIGSFNEESDFIQYLYNEELGTDLMIKIVLPDYVLVGNL